MKAILILIGTVAINLGLFLIMENMVSRDRVRLLNTWDAQTIDFVRAPQDDETRTKDRRRKPPPKPEEINKPKAQVDDLLSDEMNLPTPVAALDITSVLGAGGIALGSHLVDGTAGTSDILLESDLTPVSKFPPQYPPGAQRRGMEGFVEVIFLVRPDGTVSDATVISSEPGDTFVRSALEAVRRWRYRPVIIDGSPATVRVRVVVEYEISD